VIQGTSANVEMIFQTLGLAMLLLQTMQAKKSDGNATKLTSVLPTFITRLNVKMVSSQKNLAFHIVQVVPKVITVTTESLTIDSKLLA
jgi:hypothetical protein